MRRVNTKIYEIAGINAEAEQANSDTNINQVMTEAFLAESKGSDRVDETVSSEAQRILKESHDDLYAEKPKVFSTHPARKVKATSGKKRKKMRRRKQSTIKQQPPSIISKKSIIYVILLLSIALIYFLLQGTF